MLFTGYKVRLSEKDGRVELKLGDVWGSVCGRHWTSQNARVVCRELHEKLT